MDTIVLMWMLMAPLNAGPIPTAHAVEPGWSAGVELTGFSGPRVDDAGFRISASYSPHSRLWTELELAEDAGWRVCMDCGSNVLTWNLRGTVVDHPNFQLAGWSAVTMLSRTFDAASGIAVEGGSDRVRVDTSWPLWATYDRLTTLRAMPEIGVAYAWSEAHYSRIAVVGLEPAVALTHRLQLEGVALQFTARAGEEGWGGSVGVRFNGQAR